MRFEYVLVYVCVYVYMRIHVERRLFISSAHALECLSRPSGSFMDCGPRPFLCCFVLLCFVCLSRRGGRVNTTPSSCSSNQSTSARTAGSSAATPFVVVCGKGEGGGGKVMPSNCSSNQSTSGSAGSSATSPVCIVV